MSRENDEALDLLKQTFDIAATAVDEAFGQLETARVLEQRVGRMLEKAYEGIFNKGFVIENVTDPSKIDVSTEVSYPVGGLFGGSRREQEWLPIGDISAARLCGQLVTNVHVSSPGTRSIYDNQLDKRKGFRVGFKHDSSSYAGELDVIEWRLPTPNEVRALGRLVARKT